MKMAHRQKQKNVRSELKKITSRMILHFNVLALKKQNKKSTFKKKRRKWFKSPFIFKIRAVTKFDSSSFALPNHRPASR